MQRREFISLIGGAAAWPLAAQAQQKVVPVVGFLSGASPGPYAPFVDALRQGLSDAGYFEKSLTVEYRWAEGRYDQLPSLAVDLVGRNVDIIVTSGGNAPALAAKNATSKIPIVFVTGDPLEVGLVASLAKPGGNLTGVSMLTIELTPKRFELASELVPEVRVIALLVNPTNPNSERITAEVQEAARAKDVKLLVLKASNQSEIDASFAALVQQHGAAIVVDADAFFTSQRAQLVALASHYAVPAIYGLREFATSGGLMSYGTSLSAVYRLAGNYAGKILKGSVPADLPVEQPTQFEMVINLKTAKALGLTVPPTLLAQANEVIE